MLTFVSQSGSQNRLLAGLSPADFALLQPSLSPTAWSVGERLIEAHRPITTIYFPDSGVASLVSDTGAPIEFGMVGREGCVGSSVALDVGEAPLSAIGQVAGEGLSIPTAALRAAVEQSRTLRSVMLRFTHVLMMQAASTCYVSARLTIEQRLARWLLMCHDRVDGDDLVLTHEVPAMALCVRRPGVTVAMHILEGLGAIRTKRGRIMIRDRAKLVEFAGDSYGLAEAEYERILGSTLRPRAVTLENMGRRAATLPVG